MRRLLVLLVLILSAWPASAATIYVPDDYPTIQGAIDASSNGDTIIVRPGTYVENLNFLGKEIALRSERGPDVTIVDGGSPGLSWWGSCVTFYNGESPAAVLDGFTLTNGLGRSYGTPNASGGGIYCAFSAPTICNNVIVGNSALDSQGHGSGGGISVWPGGGPGLTIVNNVIKDNVAGMEGGGIFMSGCDGATVDGNLICDNHSGYLGGGLYLNWCEDSTLVNNIIVRNATDGAGGGILANYTHPKIRNCTIGWNLATTVGGGVYVEPYSATITNTILWGNLPNQLSHLGWDVTYSDVEGGYPGAGNIDAKPLFADALNRDFHLTLQSPCREAGDNVGVSSTLDWEGDPRIAGERVDMGADEFYFHLYHVGDVVPGGTVDIKVVGAPGMAPVRLGVGIEALTSPRQTPYGDLYLGAPIIYTHDLGMIPPTGILVLPATIPALWSAGDARPMQALVGALGRPFTRLTNLDTLRVQ